MDKVPTYSYYLGNESNLNAYSIDPQIGVDKLEAIVRGHLLTDGTRGESLDTIYDDAKFIKEVKKFSDLNIQISGDRYEVPCELKLHWDAVNLKYNDSVIVFKDGRFGNTLNWIEGTYRDFVATQFTREPHLIAPEHYDADKTVGDLIDEWGMNHKRLARCLGFAHLLTPDNGDEVAFVKRSKGVHVNPDSMTFSGSTPQFPDDFDSDGFDIDTYLGNHLADEMEEEHNLGRDEFRVSNIKLMDNVHDKPLLSVNITTERTTRELAELAFNNQRCINEHSIFYSTDRGYGITAVMRQFDFLF